MITLYNWLTFASSPRGMQRWVFRTLLRKAENHVTELRIEWENVSSIYYRKRLNGSRVSPRVTRKDLSRVPCDPGVTAARIRPEPKFEALTFTDKILAAPLAPGPLGYLDVYIRTYLRFHQKAFPCLSNHASESSDFSELNKLPTRNPRITVETGNYILSGIRTFLPSLIRRVD